jgi:hypothetical protein
MKKIIFLILLAFVSCSKDEFSANKQTKTTQATPSTVISSSSCAGFTLIKPEVDFLFLWDNSSSQFFVNDGLRQALNNTINLVSEKFNYHIMVAPLLGSGNTNAFVVAENNIGITYPLTPKESASSMIAFPVGTGSQEQAFERSYSLINNNRTNGVFRPGSNLIVIVMSNGDEIKTANGYFDGPGTDALISTQKANLINLRNNVLMSNQMRFISLVSHTACQAGFKQNYSYKKMSQQIYSEPYANPAQTPHDQQANATPDSYDICGTSFTRLFDGINNSINEVLLAHKYNRWPVVGSTGCLEILSVKKTISSTSIDIFDNATNGYTNMGMQTNINTRELPTIGEPYTGHVIQLNGTAKATYPECIVVETKTPTVNYGYVHMANCPLESTITLRINGAVIPKNATNGWQYFGRADNLNITTNSSSCVSPELKSGFFLKLYGSAVYSSGASVQVDYNTSTSCP